MKIYNRVSLPCIMYLLGLGRSDLLRFSLHNLYLPTLFIFVYIQQRLIFPIVQIYFHSASTDVSREQKPLISPTLILSLSSPSFFFSYRDKRLYFGLVFFNKDTMRIFNRSLLIIYFPLYFGKLSWTCVFTFTSYLVHILITNGFG